MQANAQRWMVVAALLLANLPGGSGFASPAERPTAVGTRDDFRAELRAYLTGARYKPAAPVQAAKIRDSNRGSSRMSDAHEATGLDPGLFDYREPRSRTDQWQAIGLALFARGGRALFYDLETLLLIQQGESRFARVAPDSGQLQRPAAGELDTITVLPGDRMRLGLRFCKDRCEFSLGRRPAGDEFADGMSGGHGSLTGAHLSFDHPGYGGVFVAPLYRPELSGSYFSTSPESVSSANGHRLRSDFAAVARKSRSYGQRIAGLARFAAFRVGLDYAIHRQSDTANPADDRQTNAFRRAVDHIQYTGLGLGYRGRNARFRIHYQRSAGAYRSLLAVPTNETRDGQPVVERRARIAGGALRANADLHHRSLSLRLKFFLPEPATRPEPGQAPGTNSTGYVGFGDSHIQAPILAGTLDFRPAPELCHERGLCEGISIRNFSADRAASPNLADDVLETGFRDHAAVFEMRAAYEPGEFAVDLALTVLAPLAPRAPGGRTPFQKIKKDPRAFEYRELDAGVAWTFPGEGRIALRYSRLYRRHRAAGSSLAGESLRVRLEYRF